MAVLYSKPDSASIALRAGVPFSQAFAPKAADGTKIDCTNIDTTVKLLLFPNGLANGNVSLTVAGSGSADGITVTATAANVSSANTSTFGLGGRYQLAATGATGDAVISEGSYSWSSTSTAALAALA